MRLANALIILLLSALRDSNGAALSNLRGKVRDLKYGDIEEVAWDGEEMAWDEAMPVAQAEAAFALDLQNTAEEVVFPGPCPSLPAGRVFDFQENSNNDGWTLVDFCLEGGWYAQDCHFNDDDSSSEELGFSFALFGELKTKVYINTNGNLSFDNLFSAYTSTGFPVFGYPMVAPFWADVDTRGPNGLIWRKQVSAHTFAIAWDNVGYYPAQGDKRNTFQVMISDGSDSNMGSGNNVCFCYADMEWTTGLASGGDAGFGGSPATVGVNKGDGENYLQIGLYNATGTGEMGVDILDGYHACFSVSGEQGNVPPIPVGFPQHPIDLPCDASITDLRLSFTAPENTQTTYLGVFGLPVDGMSVAITDGDIEAVAIINWYPISAASVTLLFTATDNGNPVGQTDVELQLSYPGPCNTPPVAVCTDVTVSAEGPDCRAYASIDNGSYDTPDDIIQLEQQPEGPYGIGSTNVNLIVTDQGGVTDACTATITVEDTTGPTAVCEENVVIQLDGSGNAQLDASQVDAGSWDNCGGVSLLVEPSAFTCDNLGENQVMLTVTDAAGLTSSCIATITVEDIDEDGDGIFECSDECSYSSIPELVPTQELKPNNSAMTGANGLGVFVTAPPKGKGNRYARIFTMEETRGCTCEQIIDTCGYGEGLRKFGCPPGIMEKWIDEKVCGDE